MKIRLPKQPFKKCFVTVVANQLSTFLTEQDKGNAAKAIYTVSIE